MQNGYYYRLTEQEFEILSGYLALLGDQTLILLLQDFVQDGDDYYALCDEVDFGEQTAILDAGLELDMWIYVKSSQWVHA